MTEAKGGKWAKGQSGNPAGRKPGALALAKLIEPDLPKLVKMLRDQALKFKDANAARILIDRCVPSLRPETAKGLIPGLEAATSATEKAEAIINAAGRGEISPTVATELLNALAAVMKVFEVDDLQKRIEALEQRGP